MRSSSFLSIGGLWSARKQQRPRLDQAGSGCLRPIGRQPLQLACNQDMTRLVDVSIISRIARHGTGALGQNSLALLKEVFVNLNDLDRVLDLDSDAVPDHEGSHSRPVDQHDPT